MVNAMRYTSAGSDSVRPVEGDCSVEGHLMTKKGLQEEKILNQPLEGGELGRGEGVGGMAFQVVGTQVEAQKYEVGGELVCGDRPSFAGHPL